MEMSAEETIASELATLGKLTAENWCVGPELQTSSCPLLVPLYSEASGIDVEGQAVVVQQWGIPVLVGEVQEQQEWRQAS